MKMKKEGDTIRTSKGEYVLGKKIGGGMEGTVFDIASPSNVAGEFAVKIINTSGFDEPRKTMIRKRLAVLQKLGERNDKLRGHMALPRALLIGDDVGYIMKKANDYESLASYLSYGDDECYKPGMGLKKRYLALAGLFKLLRDLHLSGFVFTDLSPNNILVHKEKNITILIDTDNIYELADGGREVMGTPGYIAPEIYRKDVPDKIGNNDVDPESLCKHGRATVDSDIFSAAVVAFELFTMHHPFVGDVIDDGTADDEDRAKRIETDYIFKEGTKNKSTRDMVIFFEDLTTPNIRRLFYRTFVDGVKNPSLRPTDKEFYDAFLEGLDHLKKCDCG